MIERMRVHRAIKGEPIKLLTMEIDQPSTEIKQLAIQIDRTVNHGREAELIRFPIDWIFRRE